MGEEERVGKPAKIREGDILRKVSLMSIYYLPGTVLVSRDRMVIKLLSDRNERY